MAKIIGYLIGGLFVLGMVLAPIGGATYFLNDLYQVHQLEIKTEATITGCFTLRNTKTGRPKAHRVPKAITKDGVVVRGTLGQIKIFDICKSSVGDKVSVFLDAQGSSKGRFNTFYQLWFMPLLFTLMSLFWYPFLIKTSIKKYFNK